MKPLSDNMVKLVVWCVGFTGITVLIALGKLTPDAIKYALMYAAGTLGNSLRPKGLPGLPGGSEGSSEEKPENNNA